ncbi:MAG: FGGY-family carbohydrate kinase [Spirochaetota bacterium]
MRSGRHVAVLDIGKTNKKAHVYDESLELVDGRSRAFESIDRDGVPWVPSEEIEEWLLDALSALGARYEIGLVSIAAHGATFACVDANGELAIPIVDYTYEPGEAYHRRFYELVGAPDDLQRTTATVQLPALLNVAQGVFFLQQTRASDWERVRSVLFYSQYLAYRLTGKIAADYTYAACHTYLLDFESTGYSFVADKLGIRDLLPEPIEEPGRILGLLDPAVAGRTGLSPETEVVVGIHDSNASLLPYLVKRPGEDLIVNSTGTWCVAMHPQDHVSFHQDEIGKAVFYNMSAFRRPVKTSILMGGLEFETYTTLMRERFGMTDLPEFDPKIYRDVVKEAAEFILPAVVPGTGQFPDSRARIVDHDEEFTLEEVQSGARLPELMSNAKRAFAVLNLSLAVQTVTALERVGLRSGVTVYTEGGFRSNHDYNALLATLLPDVRFRLSGMPEATSFGAALLGWAVFEGVPVAGLGDRFDLVEEPVGAVELPGLDEYVSAFRRRLEADPA